MALSNRTAYRIGVAMCVGGAAFFSFGSITAFLTKRYWGVALALALVALLLHMLRDMWRSYKGVTRRFEVRDGALYDRDDVRKAPIALSSIKETCYDRVSGFITLIGSNHQPLVRVHIDNPISSHFVTIEDKKK